MKDNVKKFTLSAFFLGLFIILTVCLLTIDVRPIGHFAQEGETGLATINNFFYNLLPLNNVWKTISELIGYLCLGTVAAFGVFGLVQLIKRKNLLKVDHSILALGAIYIVILILYFVFSKVSINIRPVDCGEGMEPSFPSSHTLMIASVLGMAVIELKTRIRGASFNFTIRIICIVLLVLGVLARFLSGVHWFTDIVAGLLLSGFFISTFYTLKKILK